MPQIAADKQTVLVTTTEQKAYSLVDVIENLSVRDSAGETKKSSKAERTKTKADRPKGRTPAVAVMMELTAIIEASNL